MSIEEQLRRFEVLQYTPEELEIRLNKYTFLKHNLEKIEKLHLEIIRLNCLWVQNKLSNNFELVQKCEEFQNLLKECK